MKKPNFFSGYYYHIFNRGVDKRPVFKDDSDYMRFIENLQRFNKYPHTKRSRRPISIRGRKLIEISAFCLMPNHFHLLIKQNLNGGVVKFMHKLGTGYTMYFNKKYNRTGSLFESRYKAKAIGDDKYIVHLSAYIHLNPVKGNHRIDYKVLENYRWSSYLDYIGEKTYPEVISKEFILSYFNDSPNKYRQYISEMSEVEPPTWIDDG